MVLKNHTNTVLAVVQNDGDYQWVDLDRINHAAAHTETHDRTKLKSKGCNIEKYILISPLLWLSSGWFIAHFLVMQYHGR